MWIDFIDLIKACLKDSYALPNIDLLVDSIACNELMSFMDSYSSFHQIRLDLENEENTLLLQNMGLIVVK